MTLMTAICLFVFSMKEGSRRAVATKHVQMAVIVVISVIDHLHLRESPMKTKRENMCLRLS
jgi:hypothetical protein